MWALLATAYFGIAVILNAIVSRVFPFPPLASFFLSGSLIGLALIAHTLLTFDAAIFAFAAIFTYAAACELLLIVISALVSSIAVRSIRYLYNGPLSDTEFSELYDARHMVKLRLNRVHDIGLAERNNRSWRLTGKGKKLLSVLRALRAIFGHTGEI